MNIHSFYRVSRTYPAPIVPIFRDKDGKYYLQEIDEKSRILSFQEFDPDRDRVIIETQEYEINKEIGDSAIFAIEYTEKLIKSGDISQISNQIIILNDQNYFRNSPFALLELASLVKIPELIEKAVRECSKALQLVDHNLAKTWIKGSDVDAALKNRFIEIIESDQQLEEVHLSFTSSYLALINLTEFSRTRLGRYRSQVFRDAIEDMLRDGLSFMNPNIVKDFLQIFLKSVHRELPGEDPLRFHVKMNQTESRGNIKIKFDDYIKFISTVESRNMNQYVIFEVDNVDNSLIYQFFFENRSKFLIFLIYVYYFVRFPEFKEALKDMSFLSARTV